LVPRAPLPLVIACARLARAVRPTVRPRKQTERPVMATRIPQQCRRLPDGAVVAAGPCMGAHQIPAGEERFLVESHRPFRLSGRFRMSSCDAEKVGMHATDPGVERIVVNGTAKLSNGCFV